MLGEGGGSHRGIIFNFWMSHLNRMMPCLIKLGIGQVCGTVPDDFVAFIESVKVVLVNFIAEAVF